jgi:hypothetical protein
MSRPHIQRFKGGYAYSYKWGRSYSKKNRTKRPRKWKWQATGFRDLVLDGTEVEEEIFEDPPDWALEPQSVEE